MSDLSEMLTAQRDGLLPSGQASTSPLLADALADLSAAGSAGEIAAVAVAHAAALTGARGAALGLLTPARTELALAGSLGYDCAAMAVGARLPMDAGLPITRAAATGRPVVAADAGGGWVAVPVAVDPARPLGALLVSLRPSSADPDVELLTALAAHVRRALHRSVGTGGLPAAEPPVTAAPEQGTVARTLAGIQVACRSEPLHQGAGGDLIEVIPDHRGGAWVIAADACGSDWGAHEEAERVRLLVRALARHVDDPAQLLEELDELLSQAPGERYVTALALHVTPLDDHEGARIRLASAGHPLPIVVTGADADGETGSDALATGLPLNLRLERSIAAPVHELLLPRGGALLAYTDGLTDRRDRAVDDDIVAGVFARATRLAEPATALETVFAVLSAAQGTARDDAAAVLLRIG
ncbi:MAG: SpoIIE family protein phosphatase [Frankiaceae bacterium]